MIRRSEFIDARILKDLTKHRCINLRLSTQGGLHAREFEKDGETTQVSVECQVTLHNGPLMLDAPLDGLGLCFLPLDSTKPHFDEGRVVPVLQDWWPTFSGSHLYFPSRRQMSPAMTVVVDALRWLR